MKISVRFFVPREEGNKDTTEAWDVLASFGAASHVPPEFVALLADSDGLRALRGIRSLPGIVWSRVEFDWMHDVRRFGNECFVRIHGNYEKRPDNVPPEPLPVAAPVLPPERRFNLRR